MSLSTVCEKCNKPLESLKYLGEYLTHSCKMFLLIFLWYLVIYLKELKTYDLYGALNTSFKKNQDICKNIYMRLSQDYEQD